VELGTGKTDENGQANHFEAALEEIAKVRPTIDPSSVLLKSVKEELSR